MVRRVDHLDLQVDLRALVVELADEEIGHGDFVAVDAVGVGFTTHLEDRLARHIGDAAAHDDFAARHRLAEEVMRLNHAGCGFAGQIKVLIRLESNLEARQVVGLDLDRARRRVWPDLSREYIVARSRLCVEGKVGAGNAVFARRQFLAHQLVALRVGHGQRQRLGIGSAQVERVERQRAQVNDLPRLVDGLVAGDEHIVSAPDVDFLREHARPRGCFGANCQRPPRRIADVRRLKFDQRRA